MNAPSRGSCDIALKCRSNVVRNLTLSRASIPSLDSSDTWLRKFANKVLSAENRSKYLQQATTVRYQRFVQYKLDPTPVYIRRLEVPRAL